MASNQFYITFNFIRLFSCKVEASADHLTTTSSPQYDGAMFKLEGNLLIEPTSRCLLSCPRCARIFDKGKFPQVDLPLEFFEKRLSVEVMNKFNFINLSGNYGDPIYHKDFLKIIEHLKKSSATITIRTNGSYKKRKFWECLLDFMGSKDEVTFSIDGLQDTNHLYRKNSDWESIMTAINVLSGKVFLEWKYIIFRHNENQIDQAKKMAKELGFNKFTVVKSSLFGKQFASSGSEVDPLEPTYRLAQAHSPPPRKFDEISPRCQESPLHYITSEGRYFPCCWSGHFNDWFKDFEPYRTAFDLNQFELQEVIESKEMQALQLRLKKYSEAPLVCRRLCRRTETSQGINKNSNHQVSSERL